MLTKNSVASAMSNSYWDLGNKVLYDLCLKYPKHEDYPEILAKIWIIGRTYAAAIERRKSEYVELDENFYIDKVVPKVWNSEIDAWFDRLREHEEINQHSVPIILEVHSNLTKLFSDISGLEKRSLASKYLHFHFPNLYFIYDTRAVKSLPKFKEYTRRIVKFRHQSADNEYRKLFEKCLALKLHIEEHYGVKITPRQIDKILLDA